MKEKKGTPKFFSWWFSNKYFTPCLKKHFILNIGNKFKLKQLTLGNTKPILNQNLNHGFKLEYFICFLNFNTDFLYQKSLNLFTYD